MLQVLHPYKKIPYHPLHELSAKHLETLKYDLDHIYCLLYIHEIRPKHEARHNVKPTFPLLLLHNTVRYPFPSDPRPLLLLHITVLTRLHLYLFLRSYSTSTSTTGTAGTAASGRLKTATGS